MKISSKAISSIVSISLLLVIAVFSTIGFQNWNTNFNSQIFLDIETKNQNSQIKIEGIINNNLYIKSNSYIKLDLFKIQDKIGNISCEFDRSKDINIENLSLHLKFDKLISNTSHSYFKDFSNNSLHAYSNNTNSTPSLINSGLDKYASFDGNDYLVVNSNTLLKSFPNTLFVSYKLSNQNPGYLMSGEWIGTSANDYTRFFFENDSIYFSFGTGDNFFKGQTDYATNLKSNFIQLRDLVRGGKLFLNSNMFYNDVNDSGVNGAADISNGLQIGRNQRFINNNFTGLIEEIRIYQRVLNISEINYLNFHANLGLDKGLNIISLSSCNLSKNKVYNILAFTENGNKLEQEVYIK